MNQSIDIAEVMRTCSAGGHVLIPCVSKYRARACAEDFYRKFAASRGWSMKGCTICFDGGGSLEFGWVETSSGRRMDDFENVSAGVVDNWSKQRIPA